MNCILYAVFLPNPDKDYVLNEIFSYFLNFDPSAQIFIGIQYNSVPETENILKSINPNLNLSLRRVPSHLLIDSDASSFIQALQLYSESLMNFDKCYFVHTKSITTHNDPMRFQMFNLLFNKKTVQTFFNDKSIGSYGPFLTLTDVQEDIKKMSSVKKFTPLLLTFPVMEYYYINTFFVLKNFILKNFIQTVSPLFFKTNVLQFSDRWFFERDFFHIVDMQGFKPSFSFFHGNYSTHYKLPTQEQYQEKLNKWSEQSKGILP